MSVAAPYVYADPVRATVDYLAERLPEYDTSGAGVGVFYPGTWPFVQVAHDGTPYLDHPVQARATIRVVCWAANPSPATDLANLVFGLLTAHPGDEAVWTVLPFTGPLPGFDADTGAYLASITVGVSVKPAPA